MNTKFYTQTIVAKSDTTLSTQIAEEMVLLNTLTGDYIGLDEVGTTIWQKIQTPITFENLCNDLLTQFEVEKAVCEKDTFAFLTELLNNKLIELQIQ